jgi:hypothetical protein
MDDLALTATGFGWIAAWENRKNAGNGSPEGYIAAANSAIVQAFSPMSQNGGGPCYYVIGSNPIQCNGDFAGNPNCHGRNCPVRIMGANHDIENPAYGFGLLASIASACAGLYVAGSPCDLSGQGQIAAELMKSAQDRLANGDNSHFASTSRPDAAGQACLDFKTVALTADCADTTRRVCRARIPISTNLTVTIQGLQAILIMGAWSFTVATGKRSMTSSLGIFGGPTPLLRW